MAPRPQTITSHHPLQQQWEEARGEEVRGRREGVGILEHRNAAEIDPSIHNNYRVPLI